MLICRLCGDIFETSSKPGTHLYGGGSGKLLLEEIQQLLSIKIFEDDPLPKYVCHSCKNKLDMFIEFRNCSQESQMSLWKNFITKGSSCFEDRSEYRKWTHFRHPIVDHWLLEMILNGTRIDRIDPVVKHRIWKLYRALWKKKVKNTGDEENDVLLKLAATPVVLINDVKTLRSEKYKKILEAHCANSQSGKQKLLSETVNRLKSLRMYRAVRGLNNEFPRYRDDSPSPPPKRPRRGASRVLSYDDNLDDDLEYLDDTDSYSSFKTSSDKGETASFKTENKAGKNSTSNAKSAPPLSDLENVLPAYNIPLERNEISSVGSFNDKNEQKPDIQDTESKTAVSSSHQKHYVNQKTSSSNPAQKHANKGKIPNILRKNGSSSKKGSSTSKPNTNILPPIEKINKATERSNYLDIFKTSLERKTSNDGSSSVPLLHEELNLVPELDISCEDGSPEYVEDPVIREVEKAVLELTKTMSSADHRNQSASDSQQNGINDDPLSITDEQIIEAQDMLMNNEADPLALDTLPLEAFETPNDQSIADVPNTVQVVPPVTSLEKRFSAVGRVQSTGAPVSQSVPPHMKFVVNQTNPPPVVTAKKVTTAPSMFLESALKKPQQSVKPAASNPPSKPQQSLTLDQQIEGILVQIMNKPSQAGNAGGTSGNSGIKQGASSAPSPQTVIKPGISTVLKKCPPPMPIDNLIKPAAEITQSSVPTGAQGSVKLPTIRVRSFSTLTASGNEDKTSDKITTKNVTQNTNNFQSRTINPTISTGYSSSTKSTATPTTTASSTAFHLKMNNVRVAAPNVTVRPAVQNIPVQQNVNTVRVSPGMMQSNINTIHVVRPNVNTVQVVQQNVAQPTLSNVVSPNVIQSVSLNTLPQSHNIVLPQQTPVQIVQPEPVQVSVNSHLSSPVSYVNVQQNTSGYSGTNIQSNQNFYQNFSNSSISQNPTVSSTNPPYSAYSVQKINPGQTFHSNSSPGVIVSQASGAHLSANKVTNNFTVVNNVPFRTLTKSGSNVVKINKVGPKGRIEYVKDGNPNSLAYLPVLVTGGNSTTSVTATQSSLSSQSYVTPISTSAAVTTTLTNTGSVASNYINKYRGKHLCICCCAIFDSQVDCYNHVQLHLPHNHAFCHVCGIRMKDLFTLKQHVELCLLEQSPSTEKFYCVVCKMSFASKFGMMYHKCNMSQVI